MEKTRQEQLGLLRKRFQYADIEKICQNSTTPLLLIDQKRIISQYQTLQALMPRVTPYFAMKSCPHPEVIKILQSIDARIDVATVGEIKILKELQYSSELLIHTHPHKKTRDIVAALDYGITSFVIDSMDELDKLEDYKDTAHLMLRLAFPNDGVAQNLSYKFGLMTDEAFVVLEAALKRGFNVDSIGFHVGSQVNHPSIYSNALKETHKFCQVASQSLGHTFKELDIGGGFPSVYTEPITSIEEFASVINPLLDEYFSNLTIRSQPGRYIVNPCITGISSVVSISKRSGRDWIFIDDGVYGTFSDTISGHSKYLLYAASELEGDAELKPYIVGGPTCDSIDVIDEAMLLPQVHDGDLLIAPNIGAYSWALLTEFNSIEKPKVVVV